MKFLVVVTPLSIYNCGLNIQLNTLNTRRSVSRGNRAPPSLDFLRRPRVHRRFRRDLKKVEGIALKPWSSFKGLWTCCETGYIIIEIAGTLENKFYLVRYSVRLIIKNRPWAVAFLVYSR